VFLWKNYDSLFFDGFDYLTCDGEQLEIIGKINTGKANTYKEVSAMATCSIFDTNDTKYLQYLKFIC